MLIGNFCRERQRSDNSLTIPKHTPGKCKEIMEHFKKEATFEGDLAKEVNVCSRV